MVYKVVVAKNPADRSCHHRFFRNLAVITFAVLNLELAETFKKYFFQGLHLLRPIYQIPQYVC